MKRGTWLSEIIAVTISLLIIFGIVYLGTKKQMDTLDKAKLESYKSTVLNYIDSVEKQIMINSFNNDETDNIIDGVYKIEELENKKVNVVSSVPEDGWVQIENKKVTKFSFKYKNFVANKTTNKKEATIELNGKLAKRP